MKLNKQPCHIIQIFSNSYLYDKKYKDYNSRKEYVQWKNELSSQTLCEDKVLISKDCYESSNEVLQDLIILVDYNFHTYEDYLNLLKLNDQQHDKDDQIFLNYKSYRNKHEALYFGTVRHAQNVEIFKIRFEDEIGLFLNWDYWKTGEPKRESFKIAELKKGVPVNVKIDGKTDFSLTGRRKRTYIENNYILEYKGVFDEIVVLNENRVFTKRIPNKLKEIDLMKHVK